jgi:flagellar hook-length control protein FliK
VLLDNLPALRERLAEQNVRIERFDVDVRGDASGGQPNFSPHQHDHQQQGRPSPSSRASAGRASDGRNDAEDVSPARRTITDTSINVVA